MRIIKIPISQIQYQYTEYNQSLYHSIIRIGLSFPIKVILNQDSYQCVDGHKRLSALHDILKNESHYHRGDFVCVIVENNGNTRSNDCWRGRNSH
ncbi:MAG: hypothetical protein HFF36_08270 [Coprobacillus sp.]|nr:hypothetical protein [Coprobacillus sp.]